MSDDKIMSDSSGSTSSISASEGEYTLPPDERGMEGSLNPVFDISQWAPEPPAGLQYLSLLPISSDGYQVASSIVQHDLMGKVSAVTQHRKNRRKDFMMGKNVGKNIHDEKRLRNAVNTGNLSLTEELLDSGVEPSCMDDKKRSPLHIAAAIGNKELVELLLDRGADPNQRDVIGNTPLHLAACSNHLEVITLLLRAGTDVNAMDNAGYTPLHLARSRLRIIQDDNDRSSDTIKTEVSNIIQMMKEYLGRSGQTEDLSELDSICTQLQHTSTKEELDVLGSLLADFTHLQIQKKDKPG